MAGLFSRITRRAAPPGAPAPERGTVSDPPVSAWVERSSGTDQRPERNGGGRAEAAASSPAATAEPAADFERFWTTAPAAPVADRPAETEVTAAPAEAPAAEAPMRALPAVAEGGDERPSFRHRARLRRRARYLRHLRELQLRDLGGLVLELDRAGRDRGDLVRQKLDGLRATTTELTALDGVLGDPATLLELREPGVGGSCPRCQAIHGSADAFCASCGQDLSVAPDAG